MYNTKVFSWKITDYKYGYLYIPGKSGSGLISDRITNETLLNEIANEVSEWDREVYAQKFSELSDIINSTYGVRIPGTWEDYFLSNDNKKYIVLTGKDGTDSKSKSELNEDTFEKIKKYVSSSMEQFKEDVKSDVNSVKDYTIGKVEEELAMAAIKMNTVKDEIEANNAELSSQLSSAQASLNTAAQLFDFESEGVNKQNLIKAINDSNTARINYETNNTLLVQQSQAIERQEDKIEEIKNTSSALSNEVSALTVRIESRIDALENDVTDISNTVEEMKTGRTESDSAEDAQETYSSGLRKGAVEETDFVETVDNGDGTYSIVTNIGEEKHAIKIYGYGKKLKVREAEDGLTLASNGFRYKDSSGSIISMINGNILLSNADGSGKLEIKKDGIYINGTKQ